MKAKRCLFVLVLFAVMFSYSFLWAGLIKRDDFQDQKFWWDWGSNCTSFPTVHNGLADLIQRQAYSGSQCGTYMWDGENLYQYYTAVIRMKTLTPMRPGSLGFGFWDYQPPWTSTTDDEADFNWFMKLHDPFDNSQTWWRAVTRNGETWEKSYTDLESIIDTGEWHTYKIVRQPDHVAFYVDGTLVHYTDSNLPEGLQSFHLWIDNFIYPWDDQTLPITFRGFSEPNELIADFVEIYNGQLGSSQPPVGSLLLKEMPNETGSGETRFLWKEYAFESPGGKTLVLITARAEDYGEFSDDDDIRIAIDDIDFGWDTALSFNGEESNGENRSLVYIDDFEEGEHYLDIYGDITPILYDVTVIGAENGDVILNEELNEEAPGGNNYLWKEYSFNCANDEEVILFISASAHENSGDDDDIRIILADEDFGWDTDYSFSGDQLYGEARALTILKYLSRGNHTLRIYADQTPILHNVILYGSGELNNPPVADDQSVTTSEDTPVSITLMASDVDGDALTYSIVIAPAHGSLSGTAPNVTYTPDADYNGSDSFNFKANDGTDDSNTATLSITVNAVNDPPVADNQSVTTSEDTPVSITLTASDADGDTLTYSIGSSHGHGTLNGTPPNVTYTPDADYNGPDSFTFKANDGEADSNQATVSITVTAVNDAPVVTYIPDQTIDEGGTFATITLDNYVEDVEDPDTAIVWTYSGNSELTVTITNRVATIAIPDPDWSGSETVTFTATDTGLLSDSNTAAFTVTAVNDPPVADDQSITTDEDTSVPATLTASDVDGDSLIYSGVADPTSGSLSGTAPDLTYTPNADYNGPDSFNYTVSDGNGGTDTATVSVTISPVNDDPDAVNDTATVVEDSSANAIDVLSNDTIFPDTGETLTITGVTQGGNGSVVITGGGTGLTYTPDADYFGNDIFTYTISDGNGGTNTATVTITVTAVNDAPVAYDQSVTTTENIAVSITLTASDPDGDSLTYTVITGPDAGPKHGALSNTPPDLTYTPNTGYFGSDSFTFKAGDGTIDSNVATVSIIVNKVNSPPVANPQSVTTAEDTALAITLAATDVDGDSLTYSVVDNPTHGELSGTVPNLTYTPYPDYNGPDSFTFKVNDGTIDSNVATVSIDVTVVNDAPVANPQSVTTTEDTALAITLTATDVDGDSLTYSVVDNPTHGSLSGTAPTRTYTPNSNYNGTDSFTFEVNDGTMDSSPATVSIDVTAVNDAPVADDQSVTTDEDTAVAITLTASDVEGNSLTYSVVVEPTSGSLSGTAPDLTYTPNADYNGPDSLTFKVNDGAVDSNVATVSITVNAVNDPPVAVNDAYSTNEDTPLNVAVPGVLGNDSDVDVDSLSAILVSGPSNGVLTLNPNGSFTYTPNANFNGSDSFTYKANDGTVESNVATVSISVTPAKSFCGAAPMYRDGVGNSSISAADSFGNAFLPLVPSLLALGLWTVAKRRKNI